MVVMSLWPRDLGGEDCPPLRKSKLNADALLHRPLVAAPKEGIGELEVQVCQVDSTDTSIEGLLRAEPITGFPPTSGSYSQEQRKDPELMADI